MWKRNKKHKFEWQSIFATKIIQLVFKIQKWWVFTMQKTEKKMNEKQRKIAFTAFVLISATFCVHVLYSSINGNATIPAPIDKINISLPPHVNDAATFNQRDFKAIKEFRVKLDSLLHSPDGEIKLKEIEKERPGWLDSFLIAEKAININ